jgi:hypothetical protein
MMRMMITMMKLITMKMKRRYMKRI